MTNKLGLIISRGLIALLIFALALWLRFSQLTQVPPAPYWEEVALAYDAYSLVQTGKDHHGNSWPIAAFESFGDWKPSGYFYAAAASIKAFDLSVWSVRLPAAVAGSIFVGLMGLSAVLAYRYWQIGTARLWIVLLAAATISPWAILFSRAAWEVMLATTLFLGSVISFWWFLENWQQQSRWQWPALKLSLLLAALSMYTYHSLRLVMPLMLIWTLLWWLWNVDRKTLLENWQQQKSTTIGMGMVGLVFVVILLLPLLQNLQSPVIKQRFAETSILNSLSVIEESNAAQAAAGNTRLAKILYHRYWFELQLVARQYLKHLNLNFLFLHGDANPRHSSQYFGQLYYLDAVFILLGAVFLWKKQRKWAIYLAGWWIIATLPAAVTAAAPHALRSLPVLPVWLWLISYGVAAVIQKSLVRTVLVSAAYLGFLAWFWSAYMLEYPKTYAAEWQSGYCEMYQALVLAQQQHPELPVYVTRVQGRPAMYYWFCQKIDPARVQAAETVVSKDQSEFLVFEHLKFVNGVNEVPRQPALVAADKNEVMPTQNTTVLYQSSSWQVWRQTP